MENNRNENSVSHEENLNKQQQGVDKAPGEDRGQGEQVTKDDLKNKTVDPDLKRILEQPIRHLP